jgi:hypothetical protein
MRFKKLTNIYIYNFGYFAGDDAFRTGMLDSFERALSVR